MAGDNSAARAPGSPASANQDFHPSADALPSFATIYKLYFDFVWSSVRRLGVRDEAIDDVVQEIFVVIHSRLHTLQQPDSLRSWIYGVVRRTVSTYHRSRRVRGGPGQWSADDVGRIRPEPGYVPVVSGVVGSSCSGPGSICASTCCSTVARIWLSWPTRSG